MTNEELAICIQGGDKSKVPKLWERVRKLYMVKSFSYYSTHKELCNRCGVELEDVQQQAFFAFLQTIEAYQPESGLTFSAFVNYPFYAEMQNLTGMRTASARFDPLNSCASLDKETDTEDGSGGTLGDCIPDPAALDFVETLDAQSVGQMIRAEVRKLPEPVCSVIAWHYFDGLTLKKIAERLGLSIERVRQIERGGIVTLSRRRVLVDLWNEYHHTDTLRQLERAARRSSPESYGAGGAYRQQAAQHQPGATPAADPCADHTHSGCRDRLRDEVRQTHSTT